MKNRVLVTAIVFLFATLGCVGIGATISPADGSVSVNVSATDCITENVVSRAIEAVPVVGDWVMLNWGCAAVSPPVVSP
jgi:hypothetical protein